MKKLSASLIAFLGLMFLLVTAAPAYAYIGPGLGTGAVATILAIAGSIILAVVAFLWYPIKRLRKKFSRNKTAE